MALRRLPFVELGNVRPAFTFFKMLLYIEKALLRVDVKTCQVELRRHENQLRLNWEAPPLCEVNNLSIQSGP